MEPSPEKKPARRSNHAFAAGIILILIGAAALLGRWLNIGAYTVLLLGLAMLVWGCLVRRTGWIIPGGVLTGIGLGILAMEGPWRFPAADKNGVFLLGFAIGWFLITVLTGIFTCTQWWALIPGGIMAVLGGSILVTDGTLRPEDMNLIYAGLLILGGVAFLLFGLRGRRNG